MAEAKPIILAIQNDETDAPHLVGRWLEELGFEIRVLRAFAGETVPTQVPDYATALLPLGGHMNATEDHLHPWLAPERAFAVSYWSQCATITPAEASPNIVLGVLADKLPVR